MQKSNNRFNKSRNTDKKPSFKSGSKRSESKRSDKSDKEGSSKSRFSKSRSFDKSGSDKPFRKKEFDGDKKRSFRDRDQSKSFDGDKKPFRKKSFDEKSSDRPFKKRDGNEKRSYQDRDQSKSFDGDKKPFRKKHDGDEKRSFRDKDRSHKSYDSDKKSDKPFKRRDDKGDDQLEFRDKSKDRHSDKKYSDKKDHERGYKKSYEKRYDKKRKKNDDHHVSKHTDGSIRLNKYLSNAGVSSRREADDLIKAGAVSVNGKVVTEMGYRVMPSDKITYGGETLKNEKKVYLILNKPKDYLTTTDDPRERRTVMQLIEGACRERVYPVGRLDRNTTGLLLFTNDGELATKLMHPKHGIKKVYHVLLNKNMKPADYQQLHEGVELEDGFIKPDDASFTGEGKKEIGIEIHSGKNRIVRRIFEHLGYEVVKLDRVVFAGLTKKDLPRGKWRFLNDKEIGFLKMIG